MTRHAYTIVFSALALTLTLASAPPAHGQPFEQVEPVLGGVDVQPGPTGSATEKDTSADKAAFIARYDDGEADTFVRSTADTYEIAMLFENIGGTDVTVGSVDMCWRQTGGDPKIRYEVVFWAPNGPGGAPGTEIAHFAAVATGVTATPAFHTTSVNYPLTASNVYIGVRWNPAVDPDYWACIDNDGFDPPTVHPVYRRFNEAGAWNNLSSLVPSYNALMLRAFVFTPGVFVENLFVPYYLVNKSVVGTTTLFAVRNLTSSNVSATIDYMRLNGTNQRSDNINLGPYEAETVNIRDVPGLAVGMDGFARGFVRVSTAGNPDMTPVLGGDYFQVDTVNNFATGEQLVRQFDLCTNASIRLVTFGTPTRLTVLINNPRGAVPAVDPPSFVVRPYNEAGIPTGPAVLYFTANNAVEIDASTLTALSFGTLRFDFSNSGGGTVSAEYRAGGRFSVGVASQCDDLP